MKVFKLKFIEGDSMIDQDREMKVMCDNNFDRSIWVFAFCRVMDINAGAETKS